MGLKGCQNLSTLRPRKDGHEYVGRCLKQNSEFTFDRMKEHYTAHGVGAPLLSPTLILNEQFFADKTLENVVIV